ncbi:MAG TPA: TetR/AcrR family transcriptional regulator [Armatimonadetes bacterium]|nr:TetR/AcrR family transcriptional regulator [Armatimonadota bacterium]
MADTRQNLLHVAARLFAAQGYAATTVDQIAAEAGVNKALVYYYFDSKEHLYKAVLDAGLATVSAEIDAAISGERTAAEKLRAFLRTYVQQVTARPEVFVIAFQEIAGTCPVHSEAVPCYYRAAVEALQGLIEEGCARGEFRPLDAETAAHALFGMVNSFFLQSAVTQTFFPVERILTTVMDLFLHGAQREEAP